LNNDLEELREEDGYSEWRRAEHERLTDLVQRRLHNLQNPPDCSKARKLVCDIRYCGFGCQLHHLVRTFFSIILSSQQLLTIILGELSDISLRYSENSCIETQSLVLS
jgi:glycoprotein 6-alpha-L-fucosyltransferase